MLKRVFPSIILASSLLATHVSAAGVDTINSPSKLSECDGGVGAVVSEGTGAILVDVIVVPKPGLALIGAVGVLLLLMRRSRHADT